MSVMVLAWPTQVVKGQRGSSWGHGGSLSGQWTLCEAERWATLIARIANNTSDSDTALFFIAAALTTMHWNRTQGRLSPLTTMALFPHSHIFPPFSATPRKQYLDIHCIRNFVQFMRVFSKFWKLSVRDNDHPKTQMELVKHIVCFHFVSEW